MSGPSHARGGGQNRTSWFGLQDPPACFALDREFLSIEEANQTVVFLETEPRQDDAA